MLAQNMVLIQNFFNELFQKSFVFIHYHCISFILLKKIIYFITLHQIISKKNQEFVNTPSFFIFPNDPENIQLVRSKTQLMKLLHHKFKQQYGEQSDIKWNFYIASTVLLHNLQCIELRIMCKHCTNSLVYSKNQSFQNLYRLVKISRFHVHEGNNEKIKDINIKMRSMKLFNISKYTTTREKIYRALSQKNIQNNVIKFMKSLPATMTHETKAKVICSKFKIDNWTYQSYLTMIEKQSQMSIHELFCHFDKNKYQYSYLPTDILTLNQIILIKRQNAQSIVEQINKTKEKEYQKLNPKYWHLPNVLLVVTPEMKKMFLKYGQYIGFDLTFSLIRQEPLSSKEYLVGVFGGTSESRRITVYGFAITNNQSVDVYKFLFSQFFRLMGKQPATIITDEQTAMYYALKQLKDQNLFHGRHLFDTFHILKKFRKSSGYQGEIFQLFRRLIHAKNRNQYRILFNMMMDQIRTDKQLQILKIFDYNSQMYCVSQIEKTFVSIGISDGCVQKIHDLIKQQIPYQIKYVKGVSTIIDILQKRNEMNRYGYFELYRIQKRIGMDFMKKYRTCLSKPVFENIIIQVCKAGGYKIIPAQSFTKLQQNKPGRVERNKFYVITNIGPYAVYKNYYETIFGTKQKWQCECQYEQKTGFLCSHLVKVLLYIGKDFFDNIHERWIIHEENLDERSKNYSKDLKYFSSLRPKITNQDRKSIKQKQMQQNSLYSKNFNKDFESLNINGESNSKQLQQSYNNTYYNIFSKDNTVYNDYYSELS